MSPQMQEFPSKEWTGRALDRQAPTFTSGTILLRLSLPWNSALDRSLHWAATVGPLVDCISLQMFGECRYLVKTWTVKRQVQLQRTWEEWRRRHSILLIYPRMSVPRQQLNQSTVSIRKEKSAASVRRRQRRWSALTMQQKCGKLGRYRPTLSIITEHCLMTGLWIAFQVQTVGEDMDRVRKHENLRNGGRGTAYSWSNPGRNSHI